MKCWYRHTVLWWGWAMEMVFPILGPSLEGDAVGADKASTGALGGHTRATPPQDSKKDATCKVLSSFRNKLNIGEQTQCSTNRMRATQWEVNWAL